MTGAIGVAEGAEHLADVVLGAVAVERHEEEEENLEAEVVRRSSSRSTDTRVSSWQEEKRTCW